MLILYTTLAVMSVSVIARDIANACLTKHVAEPCKHRMSTNGWMEYNEDGWFQLGADRCVKALLHVHLVGHYAENICSKFKCGQYKGNLVSIHNEEELNVITCTMYREKPSSSPFWIGLSRTRRGGYYWTDGSPVDFTKWGENQPDFFGRSEYCVELNNKDWGDFNDVNCLLPKPFMCQVKCGQ